MRTVSALAVFGILLAAAAAAPAQTTVIASQDTNWPNVVAEVTEFKRKGNTLTAKVRLRNTGQDTPQPSIKFTEVYLLDSAAGKKYQVLKDEAGAYISSLNQGYKEQWYAYINPGTSVAIWMKFPAPPATTTAISLQLPEMAPFDDLTIQDQ